VNLCEVKWGQVRHRHWLGDSIIKLLSGDMVKK